MKHGVIVGRLLDRARLALVALLFLLPSMGAFASTPVTLDTGLFFDAAGTMWYKTVGGTNTLMYPDLQISKSLPVQTVSHGTANVPVVRQPRIDLPRVGASVVGMAKLLGPIGVGITVAQLICSQSSICDSGSGVWQKPADPAVAGFPQSLTGNFYWYSPSNSPLDGSGKYPTATASCAALNAAITISQPSLAPYTWILSGETLSAANCASKNVLNQTTNYTMTRQNNSGCPVRYSLIGGVCELSSGNPVARTPSDSDWTAAKTLLSTQNMIQPLLDASQPIPVYAPPVVAPITQTIGTTSTTNPDGTRTDTTTSLTTTDTSTSSAPNSYTVSETTVTNIYNTSNVLINTTTTSADPPAPVVALSNTDTSTLAKEATLQQVRDALTNPTMPDTSTTNTIARSSLDSASTAISNLIGSEAGANKQTSLGWSFLPQLPTGTCGTIPFGVRTWLVNYDWCTDLGKARTMWGWLFAMLGALYIWRRGTAALSGQS